MQEQNSVFEGPATSLTLRYSSTPISGWGGLLVVMRHTDSTPATPHRLENAAPRKASTALLMPYLHSPSIAV